MDFALNIDKIRKGEVADNDVLSMLSTLEPDGGIDLLPTNTNRSF